MYDEIMFTQLHSHCRFLLYFLLYIIAWTKFSLISRNSIWTGSAFNKGPCSSWWWIFPGLLVWRWWQIRPHIFNNGSITCCCSRANCIQTNNMSLSLRQWMRFTFVWCICIVSCMLFSVRIGLSYDTPDMLKLVKTLSVPNLMPACCEVNNVL